MHSTSPRRPSAAAAASRTSTCWVAPEREQGRDIRRVRVRSERTDAGGADLRTRVAESVPGDPCRRRGVELAQPVEGVGPHAGTLVAGERFESHLQLGVANDGQGGDAEADLALVVATDEPVDGRQRADVVDGQLGWVEPAVTEVGDQVATVPPTTGAPR